MHVKRYQNYLEILFCMATSLFGSFPKTSKIPFYTLENPPAGRQQQILKYKELLINLTALEGHKSTVTVALQSLNKQSQKSWVTFSADPRLTSKKRLHIIFMKAYVWRLFFCGITAQTAHKAAQGSKKQTKQKVVFGIFGHSPVILSPVFIFS